MRIGWLCGVKSGRVCTSSIIRFGAEIAPLVERKDRFMTTRKKTASLMRKPALVHIVPDTAALVAVLQAHALGEHEMTPSQVTVALSLLKIYAVKPPAPSIDGETGYSHEDALQQLS